MVLNVTDQSTGNFFMDTYQRVNDWGWNTYVKPKMMISPTKVGLNDPIQTLLNQPDVNAPGHRAPLVLPDIQTHPPPIPQKLPSVTSHLAEKDHPSDLSQSFRAAHANARIHLTPYQRHHVHFVPLNQEWKVASQLIGDSVKPVFEPFWKDWHLSDPVGILHSVWDILTSTLGWVIGEYQEFYEQFRSWDGSISGLMWNVGLIWHGAMVVLLTVGIVEIGSLVESLSRILYEVGSLVMGGLNVGVTVAEELWRFVEIVFRTLTKPLAWLTNEE